MAKRLYFDVNTETGKWFDSSNPTYLLSSDKKPKLKLGEKVILCLSLFDNTGTALALNAGDTFDIGADNNFNHTDDLCLYADNTAVDVAGDWDYIDRATGKISIRLTVDSVSLRSKLSTSETLSSVKIQLRRFEVGTGDQSDYLLDEITLQNVVMLDEAAPDEPTPTYPTNDQITALLAPYSLDFTYSSLSAGILSVTHGKSSLNPVVTIKDPNGVQVGNATVTVTGSNTLTVDMSPWGVFAGTYNIMVRK